MKLIDFSVIHTHLKTNLTNLRHFDPRTKTHSLKFRAQSKPLLNAQESLFP